MTEDEQALFRRATVALEIIPEVDAASTRADVMAALKREFEHGRADLEARCQQARAIAFAQVRAFVAGLIAHPTLKSDGTATGDIVADVLTKQTSEVLGVVRDALPKLESLATSPAPAPARVAPVDDARRLLAELAGLQPLARVHRHRRPPRGDGRARRRARSRPRLPWVCAARGRRWGAEGW